MPALPPSALSRPPFERIHATKARVFGLSAPAPVCENVNTHDVALGTSHSAGDHESRRWGKNGLSLSHRRLFAQFCPGRKRQGRTDNHKCDETSSHQVTRTKHKQLGHKDCARKPLNHRRSALWRFLYSIPALTCAPRATSCLWCSCTAVMFTPIFPHRDHGDAVPPVPRLCGRVAVAFH